MTVTFVTAWRLLVASLDWPLAGESKNGAAVAGWA
jgi:hypothetical protein